MLPGQYIVQLANSPEPQGRFLGWESRDTLLILIPGPTLLFATLYRVPIEESTVAGQVLATGAGALWIDGCRVRAHDKTPAPVGQYGRSRVGPVGHTGFRDGSADHLGRWPPNLLLVHHPECRELGTKRLKGSNIPGPATAKQNANHLYGRYSAPRPAFSYTDPDGLETIQSWQCHPSCPVGLLDRQSGVSLSTGGRTRNITPSTVYGAGKGIGRGRDMTALEAKGDPGFGDVGGASRFYPQFRDLAEAIDWIDRLINGVRHIAR